MGLKYILPSVLIEGKDSDESGRLPQFCPCFVMYENSIYFSIFKFLWADGISCSVEVSMNKVLYPRGQFASVITLHFCFILFWSYCLTFPH